MSPIVLEGVTLGNRQQHYNYLVNEAIKKEFPFETFLSECGDSDIDQLFLIDLASNYRNVDYIMEVLKSEDMLYVSRAINKCSWLITDDTYAHIINCQYLHEQLFPHMTSKAISKLLLHMRLHLNDNKRGDEFYTHYQMTYPKIAVKWLPNCSLDVINKSLIEDNNAPSIKIFKKLCKKLPKVFELCASIYQKHSMQFHLEAVLFLLNSDTNKFLDIIEELNIQYWPRFNKRHTATIMKACPDRILNKFHEYCQKVDVETVARLLQADQMKYFLISIAKNDKLQDRHIYNHIEPFIKYMPKEGILDYLKDFCVNDTRENTDHSKDSPMSEIVTKKSIFYKHVSFEFTFNELQQRIKRETALEEHNAIMKTMLSAAGQNTNNIQLVIQYYHQNYINESFEMKINFLNYLLTVTKYVHLFDKEIWKILNQLFHSCEVYVESNNNVQHCVEVILVHNILYQQAIPEIIENKFEFNSLRKIRIKLNEIEKDTVFVYLLNYIETKINNLSTDNIGDIEKLVSYVIESLELLLDWKKDLNNYPSLLNKIKELALLKHKKKLDVNLNNIYNINKSWRKYMFEDCLLLSESGKVLENVLKHDPTLLQKYPKQVEALQFNDNVNIRSFLSKLKIYWKQSLAQHWAKTYRSRVHKSKDNNYKALTLGLCSVLAHKELLKLFDQCAPTDSQKGRSKKVDSNLLNLRKSFAGLMHNARPLPPVRSILHYAHGKYFQFALHSLNAIFNNMSLQKFKDSLPELLMGSEALQTFGMKIAFSRLKFDVVLELFSNMWKSENSALRLIVFQLTLNLLSKEKSKTVELRNVLEMFIKSMPNEDYPAIYRLIDSVKDIDLQIEFRKMIYLRLKALPPSNFSENHVQNCINSISDLIDDIDHDFVENILLDYIQSLNNTNMLNHSCQYLLINYLLCAPESDQERRFAKVMKPWLSQVFSLWNDMYGKHCRVSKVFQSWILVLTERIKYVFLNKINYANPTKVIKMIIKEMETNLPSENIYYAKTLCQLIIIYTESYNNIKSDLTEKYDNETVYKLYQRHFEMWYKIAPSFAVEVVNLLKDHTNKLFPNIWMIFGKCVWQIISVTIMQYTYSENRFKFEEELLKNVDSPRLAGLLAVKISQYPIFYHPNEEINTSMELKKLKEIILQHPCKEVRMQFLFRKIIDKPSF